MNDTDVAYIAGLIDGEGYIGVRRLNHRKNGCVTPGYEVRIQIRMVDEPAIKFISETLGGTYYAEKPHAHKGRPLYCYAVHHAAARRVIETVLPYLKVKRRVALVALKLYEAASLYPKTMIPATIIGRWGKPIIVRRYRHSPEYLEACEQIRQLCHDINFGVA